MSARARLSAGDRERRGSYCFSGGSLWRNAADGVSLPASYLCYRYYYPFLSGLPLLLFISLVSVIVYFIIFLRRSLKKDFMKKLRNVSVNLGRKEATTCASQHSVGGFLSASCWDAGLGRRTSRFSTVVFTSVLANRPPSPLGHPTFCPGGQAGPLAWTAWIPIPG